MTLITFDNGKPVFRDGKVGTSQGCCCNGDCLCCSCVERVAYTPSSPGASAKPFAGIPPNGEWPVDEFGRRYAEFPCHYVEYAFSQYAAQIFPNAPNAGADAAYPNSGEWERVITPGDYGSGFGYGKTQCTGSTEAECQPCLAYPSQYWYNVGPPPTADPLPTLAQLQKRCGIYHPCTPCENCSNAVDGCGVAGINQSQGSGDTYPQGIPWPPPEGTCPCRLCDLLCLEQVVVAFTSKPKTIVVDGVHYFVGTFFGHSLPATVPPISHADQPANVWLVGGSVNTGGYNGPYAWRCNSEQELSDFPIYHIYDVFTCCNCDSSNWPTQGGDNEGKATEESGWWDQEYTYRFWYYRIRVVSDCCECQEYVITPASLCAFPPFFGGPGDEYVEPAACGGIQQINNSRNGIDVLAMPDVYPDSAFTTTGSCPLPSVCETPCWENRVEVNCNPFP